MSKQAGDYFDLMIQLGVGENFEAGSECTPLWIVGGVYEPGDARLNNGTGTHGAGLESDVQSGAAKAVVAEKASALADNDNFGVGRGIVVSDSAVT
ncbi:MAG: hypothetical protein WBL63_17725 [Candidatus Acidiferrum sp.]